MKTLKPFRLLFVVLSLLALTSCVTGNGYPSWSYANHPEADQSPSQLSPVYGDRMATANTEIGPNGEVRLSSPENALPGAENGEGGGYLTQREFEAQNQQKLQEMQTQTSPRAPRVKVAILLPLSGNNASLGQAMLKAAQMALFDIGQKNFELMPRDTAGTAAGATKAAKSALRDGAQLILGPVFADSVRAVKAVTQSTNVNLVAFSTDWTLAGGNAFIMGFIPFDQVERVMNYASSHNIHRIGVLAPNTPYGSAVVSAYRTNASRLGVTTEDIQLFDPSGRDLATVVRNFSKYDERETVFEQEIRPLQERLKTNPDDKEAAAKLRQLQDKKANMPLPFEALLLPVGGEQAHSIAGMANQYHLLPSQIQRLGTGLWDDRSLASDPSLSGAWFAAPSPVLRQEFEQLYSELYGTVPPRLATLAYDATALAAVLARSGIQTAGAPAFDAASISNPNGFAGLDGIFRFRPDGLAERGLAILTFKRGQIAVLEEAPTTFQQPGRF